jgi:hypothetical protein
MQTPKIIISNLTYECVKRTVNTVVPANDDDNGTATVAQPLYCVVSAFPRRIGSEPR